MRIEKFTFQVSETIGKVSAEAMVPDEMHAVLVLAHGAGADMHHRFMSKLSRALAEEAIGTFRYNFPFTEKGKGRPDPAPVARAAVRAAIEKATELFPKENIFAGGKSFGGRMSSQLAADDAALDIKGLVFFGFPLHPAGKPSVERAEHLRNIRLPMLFLQGTRDTLAEIGLVADVLEQLPTSRLQLFEGADHSFQIGKKDVVQDLAKAAANWMKELF